jgi:phenylalanine-4-hydroxylase
LTGFEAKAVSGYIPAFLFFDCLRNREFPTTVTIRSGDALDYLPEPDIFHDVSGHVPMHTDKAFADTLVRFGECAHTAVEIVEGIRNEEERLHSLTSIVKAMARFFWFTIEFGLMRSRAGSGNELRAYGSGLLSSFGEIENAIVGRDVQRFPLQPEWVINQGFAIRSVSAAAVYRGFVRSSFYSGGHAGEMDAGGEAEQCRAGRARD